MLCFAEETLAGYSVGPIGESCSFLAAAAPAEAASAEVADACSADWRGISAGFPWAW